MSQKSYMVIFKDDAPQTAIDESIADVEAKGGKITQKFTSDFMKGYAASMPDDYAQSLTSLSEGGKHKHIEYVEPDQKVSVSA